MRMLRKAGVAASLMLIGCGLCLLLYPVLSNRYETAHHGKVIQTYREAVADLNRGELAGARAEAEAYNARLYELVRTTDSVRSDFDRQNHTYGQLLNESGDGVMSYIEIPSIDVFLPIYHGTSEAVLSKGAGHMVNTSLPVGGASTHCVISAHRGDPSATLFSDLDQLGEGDEFYLYTLNERLVYRVDQIKVVLPYETDDFRIEEGKDYVTLVTCTPYGVNSHRLLVRGQRVSEGAEPGEKGSETDAVSEERLSSNETAYGRGKALACGLAAIGGIAWIYLRKRKRHEKV